MKETLGILVAVAAATLTCNAPASAAPGDTELISSREFLSPSGSVSPAGGSISIYHAVSGDGRYVVFTSGASGLISGDANAGKESSIFVRDRHDRTNWLLRNSRGEPVQGWDLFMSDNGRFIAFAGLRTNVLPDEAPIPFAASQVFVYDRTTARFETIGKSGSFQPALSADGRFVVYESAQDTEVSGDTNGVKDVFLRDRQRGTTERISISTSGKQGKNVSQNGFVSADGRYVTFLSFALNLIDGTQLVYPGLFLRDRVNHTTTLVSVNAKGAPVQGDSGVISANGRYVAFGCGHSDLIPGMTIVGQQVYVRDLQAKKTTVVSIDSLGNIGVTSPGSIQISGDGRFVSFTSSLDTLVPYDTNGGFDAFIHDRQMGITSRASVSSNGTEQTGSVDPSFFAPAISANGRVIVFASFAANLVPRDFNDARDVFAHVRTDLVSVRLNTGGPAYTDALGRLWEADRNFSTGAAANHGVHVVNTLDSKLFEDERWDEPAAPELQYTFSLPKGTYRVHLLFAETYAPNFAKGRRVFHVDIEGKRAFTDLDVFGEVGARSPLHKYATTTVTDGQLNIVFRHKVQNPIIDAIEVVPWQ